MQRVFCRRENQKANWSTCSFNEDLAHPSRKKSLQKTTVRILIHANATFRWRINRVKISGGEVNICFPALLLSRLRTSGVGFVRCHTVILRSRHLHWVPYLTRIARVTMYYVRVRIIVLTCHANVSKNCSAASGQEKWRWDIFHVFMKIVCVLNLNDISSIW